MIEREPPVSRQETFPLRRGRPPVVLHATGFRHPGGLFAGSEFFTAYPSVTQLFVTARDDLRGDGTPRLPGIREQYERAPQPKELLVLDGAAHAQFIFDSEQGERLMREIVRFLSAP